MWSVGLMRGCGPWSEYQPKQLSHEMQTRQENGHLCPFHEVQAQAAFFHIPIESGLSGSLPSCAPAAATGYSRGSLSQSPRGQPPQSSAFLCDAHRSFGNRKVSKAFLTPEHLHFFKPCSKLLGSLVQTVLRTPSGASHITGVPQTHTVS